MPGRDAAHLPVDEGLCAFVMRVHMAKAEPAGAAGFSAHCPRQPGLLRGHDAPMFRTRFHRRVDVGPQPVGAENRARRDTSLQCGGDGRARG